MLQSLLSLLRNVHSFSCVSAESAECLQVLPPHFGGWGGNRLWLNYVKFNLDLSKSVMKTSTCGFNECQKSALKNTLKSLPLLSEQSI